MLLLPLLVFAASSVPSATAENEMKDDLIGWNFDKERVDTDLLIDVFNNFYNDFSSLRAYDWTSSSRYDRIVDDMRNHFSRESFIKLESLVKLLREDFPMKVVDRLDNDIERRSQPEDRAFRSYLKFFRADALRSLANYTGAWTSMAQARKYRQGISGGISREELARLNVWITIQRIVDFTREVSRQSSGVDSMESIEASLLEYARLLRTFGVLTVDGSTEQSISDDSALVKLNVIDREFKQMLEQRVLHTYLADLRKDALEEADELIDRLRMRRDPKSRTLEAYVQYFKADMYRRYSDCDLLADSEAALQQVKNLRQVDSDVLRDDIVKLEGKIVFKWMVCSQRWLAKK